MKKLVLFVLTVACLAGIFILEKDAVMDNFKTFKDAFSEVAQWKNLM